MTDSFYVPLGDDRWLATVHTTGPWDARHQHGGPPGALLARAVERCEPREDAVVARVTVEILGGIPVGEVTLTSRMARPGRRVELVEASLAAGGRTVARATAWRIQRSEGVHVAPRHPMPTPLPDPTTDRDTPEGWIDGYLSAVEWRTTGGRFDQPGPGAVWTRLRHPLVPDEEPTGLQRVMVVADSGSGISSELDQRRWHFINPELTVHLHRIPAGAWICLDAVTTISDGGVGLATSVLSDVEGPVGVGAQSLLVAPR